MLKEFKEFALKGNIIDMSIGVIVGGAFSKIINSMVSDIIMPLISLAIGKIDFSNLFISFNGEKYTTLAEATAAGAATLNYGLFFTNILNFLIVAFSIFFFVKQTSKIGHKIRHPEEKSKIAPTTKECPYCYSIINIKATKCPNCISELVVKK